MTPAPKKILLIQTAFIGDVILSTALAEKLHRHYPAARIDFLLRKGNEGLLEGHPFLEKVWVWDKDRKWRSLIELIRKLRKEKYDLAVNAQRFLKSGLMTALSGAKHTVGFTKNPLSFLYGERHPHLIENRSGAPHEVERNQQLIAALTDDEPAMPRLYPSEEDFKKVKREGPYLSMAPASVWYTKQWPEEKWVELCNRLPEGRDILLIGSPADRALCERIREACDHPNVVNQAGELSLLQSAALMAGAEMNYVNDSAPMHLASAMNAPVCAIYCSTVPEFGFGPLSEQSHVMEYGELYCRPCGLHGYKACPEGHFNCADIEVEKVASIIQ